MPVRPGRWWLSDLTINPDGAGHDILAPGCAPLPVVLSPRRIPRPQIRSQAGPALPWCGPGPRPADCHQLDSRRWSEPTVPALLHDRRRRRQAGQGHRRRLGLRGSQAPGLRARRGSPWQSTTRRRSATGPTSREPASITTRPLVRPGSPHVYGHIWVVLGLLAVHPAWGVDRAAAFGPDVRPGEGPAAHRPKASARVPDQARDGRRVAPMGHVLAEDTWASRCGWWSTGPTPRPRSSSRRCRWG